MIRGLIKRNWQIILSNIILLLCFIFGYGRFGNIIVDSFREAYIPEQIILGHALYKDIFTIYPPLAYIINTFLFYIFGIKLKVLYTAGFISTFGIINLTFKIASKFLPKTYSLGIILFIISAGCLSSNVFNLFFPYSFGILYGIFFILASLYFVIKKNYTLAYLFYSLAVCSKYEFIFLLPLLVWNSRKSNWKKNIPAFFVPILLTLSVLYFQGIRINDLILSAQIMLGISSAKTLYWFYSVTGLVFRPQIIPIYIINILKYILPLVLLYFYRNVWTVLVTFVYLIFVVDQEILIYAFPLILLLLIFRFKQLNNSKKFIIIASLLIGLKPFFALTLESYGIYFLPFFLVSLLILVPKKIKKPLLIIIFCASLILGIRNANYLADKNIKIQTDRGIVYTSKYYGNNFNELIEYIKQNNIKNDKVLVLPEGLAINFLTATPSDNKFYSQIPLYVEIFGEDIITKRIKITKPKYIITTNYDTSNYYYSYYGNDYAQKILKYIKDNYALKKDLKNGILINIYEIKNK